MANVFQISPLIPKFPEVTFSGAGEKLEIVVHVDNNGEDAFNAMLYFRLPDGVSYINANSTSASLLCSHPTVANNRTLECEIGNPFPQNSRVINI